MKNWKIITVLVLFSFTLFAQNKTYENNRGDQHLWGTFESDALNKEPYKTWYDKSIADYTPNMDVFKNLNVLKETGVTIYLGTWCGDSKTWVPRFLEIWKAIDLPMDRIKIIALHNEDGFYKKGLNGEEKGKNIHKVPTFIFHKDGKEVGRIVERPLTTLEHDLAQIDKGIPASPRYQAVSYLHEYFVNNTNTVYNDDKKDVIRAIRRIVSGQGELNMYGYLLKAEGEIQQAQFVFELNVQLYKYHPNTHDSLGELYMECENWEKAKECFHTVLRINPNDDRAIAMLYEINNHLVEKS